MHPSMKNTRIVVLVLFGAIVLLYSLYVAYHDKNVQVIANPAAAGAKLPRLTPLPDGSVLLSWVEKADKGHALKYAVHNQHRWIRQGTVSSGENWFINWADFPSVVAIDDSFWVAHWLAATPGGRSHDYDIQIAFSRDAGVTWSEPQTPHQDGVAAEHGFVSIFPVEGGAGIIWLDGRAYQQTDSGKFSLRYTRLGYDGKLGPEEIIDGDTCTCCQTAAAVTSSGPIAAWRSRREGEIRDHHVARMVGNRWMQPVELSREGWSIDACPVNGPVLAARQDQVMAVWFTAEGNRPRVRAAFSSDAGRHFTVTADIDTDGPVGRANVVWLDQETALIGWLAKVHGESNKSSLVVRTLSINGQTGRAIPLLDIDSGRSAGFPQLVLGQSGLMLAWTGPAPGYGVHTLLLPSDKLNGFFE